MQTYTNTGRENISQRKARVEKKARITMYRLQEIHAELKDLGLDDLAMTIWPMVGTLASFEVPRRRYDASKLGRR